MTRTTPRLAWGPAIVWLLIVLYVVLFSTLTLRRHDAFQSAAFDLGNVDQAASEITSVCGTQSGICQAFTSTMSRDKVFQGGQALTEVGTNGQGDDATGRISHQTAHTR